MSADGNGHGDPSSDPTRGLGFSLPPPARPSPTRLVLIAAIVLAVLGGGFTASYVPRVNAKKELEAKAEARRHESRRLAVVAPKLVSGDNTVVLPGSIQPLEETVVYSRANGYVRRWLADIGTRVKAGELLAEIEAPEVDQELMQARAALAQSRANRLQAEANRGFAASELARTAKLVEEGLSPKQALDQTQAQSTVGDANLRVADAAIVAQEANVRRLVELKEFTRVTAPFTGIVTARLIERGSLVTAGNATPLFRLAAVDTVRVFVQVPQSVAPSVVTGMPASVRIREFPGSQFDARVTRTSGALDAASRTLNTEIQIQNADNKLLSGMYAEVVLSLATPHRVYEVPSTALMNDASGLRVAIVNEKNAIEFRSITIERDLGPTIRIASGLEGTERVVQIASADLAAGERVEVVK